MEDIYTFLKPVDFAVVGIYLLVLIAIGYWVSFIKKRNTGENLFLAGHSLGWGSIGFTMWGTNVGPSMLIASASIGYTTGVVAGNFGWYAFVFIFLLAVVFAPRYLGARVLTLPEFMGKRFGQSTRNILAWYTLMTILISWLSLTLFAGSILVSQMLNLPSWLSVIVLVVIAAFFTVAGGLKAVAYTNVFQMLLLIVVSFILTVAGIMKIGGLETISEYSSAGNGTYLYQFFTDFGNLLRSSWHQFATGVKVLYEETPSSYWNLFLPLDDRNYPWLAIILGYPVMGVWFWCTDQSMVQSVLGARNLQQGQLGANFTGWLKIFDVALFIIPGIACFVLFPDLKDPDEAYMTMVTRLFPVGMTGLIMAVLIAALISTIDSALNSLSTVFTMDIFVKKYKPAATQKEIIYIGRLVTVIGAILAVLLTLAIESIKGLKLFDIFQAILGFLAPPMSVVFLFGVLWKKTTTRAANVALTAGTAFSLGTGVFYLWIFPSEKYTFWPHFLLVSFLLFLVIAFMTYMFTRLDNNASLNEQSSLDYGKLSLPGKKILIPWILLILTMMGLYIIFNGH
ncbi:MAG: sodium/solute symporter [Bacteroidales bacterium]|nr:sodium/solute symporter [Bacteroidales bacterium]